MLTITPNAHQRVFIALKPLDFRKGIDSIAAACRQQFQCDPKSGHYFIFRNRRKTAIKIFMFYRNGYWLCHKRLSQGKFLIWPKGQGPLSEVMLSTVTPIVQTTP